MEPEGPSVGNPFGLVEALLGLAGGFALSIVAVSAYDGIEHQAATSVSVGQTVVSLLGLWIGFVGAAVLASRIGAGAAPARDGGPAAGTAERSGSGSLVDDYGFRIRLWPDLPLGVVVGVAAQFLLVPLLELPLAPFVGHLSERLGHPTRELLGPASSSGTGQLVLIAVLICVGSPVVEELFFRGLVLRALLWRFSALGTALGPVLSIVLTGLLFGLVHFEELQFLGLAGFGMVLGVLAWRTGRIGPSIVAHVAFNASTVVAYVFVH
jgi:membrane protease YdiL (CAAX protease family)